MIKRSGIEAPISLILYLMRKFGKGRSSARFLVSNSKPRDGYDLGRCAMERMSFAELGCLDSATPIYFDAGWPLELS